MIGSSAFFSSILCCQYSTFLAVKIDQKSLAKVRESYRQLIIRIYSFFSFIFHCCNQNNSVDDNLFSPRRGKLLQKLVALK